MRLIIRMKVVEEKINTTKLEPCDEPAPLDSFFVNTERLNSLPSEEERELVLADEPFAEGEVSIDFPAYPLLQTAENHCAFRAQSLNRRKGSTSYKYPCAARDSIVREEIAPAGRLHSRP